MHDGPKAWFCVCINRDKPDGPAAMMVGPFSERDQAVQESTEVCDQSHVVVYGIGREDAYGTVTSRFEREEMASGHPWRYAAVVFYDAHPELIPHACRKKRFTH